MHNRTIIMAAVLFGLIIVGMFTFAYIKKSELSNTQTIPTPTEPVVAPVDRYASIERVDAKHFYQDGEHTIAGEILMPTPCDLLNWDAVIAESFPEQVTVNFDVINNAEICIQVESPQRFKVSFTAHESATIGATLEGRGLQLNLIPAAEGETPDNFELFLKG